MDQYQNTFQMLGQNMFSKAPPSGYGAGYHPLIQAHSNKQKFDQLIQLMQQQEQTVSDYNTRMKEKEDQLFYLEQQSMQLQRDLIQKDKQRNEHNQIYYKNYQPTFNVQNTVPMESLQTDQQQVQNIKLNKSMQAGDYPEIQSQQMQRKASIQSNQNQTRPQSTAIQGNQKLMNMQKQIEEQNQYIQQLSALVGSRKPVFDAEKDDSLAQLLNERDDLQKQHILNEIKSLKQRIDEFDHSRQQMIQQQYGLMPQQQLLQQQGMMQFQNPFGMLPPMYPPNNQLQQQQQSEESDDNDLNNEILMKLIDQQNRQKKRGTRNRQNSRDNKDRNQKRDRRHTQKKKQQDDDANNGGDGD